MSSALVGGLCVVAATGCDADRGDTAAVGRDGDEAMPCDEGDDRPCDAFEKGMQYCLADGTWGVCFDPAKACTPGDEDLWECGDAEFPGSQAVECEVSDEGVPEWQEVGMCEGGGGGTTPLALVPAGVTPRFMAADDRFFALSASGCNTDWPTSDTPWLARDLDGNGRIDGGHELFGSLTDVGGRTARHGFEALARLDENRDGVVDARDPAFAELVLWADVDGDRLALPGELMSLSDAGVRAIPLGFHRERTCDGRGNCGFERVDVPGAQIVDLYLPCR